MHYVAFALLFLCSVSWSQSQGEMQVGCNFVRAWANQAFHISHALGLEEDRWLISEDGYDPPTYQLILDIKHEAYHDLAALRRRVEMACAEKQGT